jgi:hypothetical protein
MDGMMRIDKQHSGLSLVSTGGCRQTRVLRTVREARAPPVDGIIPTQDGTVITMQGGHLE